MKPTKSLALALMLNVLINTNSALGGAFDTFQKVCIKQGIPAEPPLDSAKAQPKTKQPPLILTAKASELQILSNDGDSFSLSPTQPSNNGNLTSSVFGNNLFQWAKAYLQINKNATGNTNQLCRKVIIINVLYGLTGTDPDDFTNRNYTVLITIYVIVDGVIDNPDIEPLLAAMQQANTNGSTTLIATKDGYMGYNPLEYTKYFYLTPKNCTDPDSGDFFYYTHIELPPTASRNISYAQMDMIANLIQPIPQLPMIITPLSKPLQVTGIEPIVIP